MTLSVLSGAKSTGKDDVDAQVDVTRTQTGPIQACCTFLLHSLSWLVIILTFPFSVCLCLKVSLHDASPPNSYNPAPTSLLLLLLLSAGHVAKFRRLTVGALAVT